jgi:transketolase
VRNEFIAQLQAIAGRDERVILLTGDLGFMVLEDFSERFPDRCRNVGVAEQNMVGMATGMAEGGLIPFCYSIATFASMRPYEFIRNGPALHELPVRVVGIGGGLDYGYNGVTHYALEDVGIMRVQPAITTVAPADPEQAVAALDATWELPNPIYYRLGKQSTTIPSLHGRFSLGEMEMLSDGRDLAIVALGTAAQEAREAASLLQAEGIDAAVGVVSSFNPSPADDLANVLEGVPLVLTVEAHYAVGGLGSLVAEVIAERGLDCRLVRRGVERMPRAEIGGPDYLNRVHQLDAASLAREAVAALQLSGF